MSSALKNVADAEALAAEAELADEQEPTLSTNLPNAEKVVSLVDGSVTPVDASSKKRKGRPCIHPLSGRITFRREEVQAALENGPVFIEQMEKNHALSEDRRATLLADGILETNTVDMFFTYQGPIDMVLREMERTLSDWGATQHAEGTTTKDGKKVSWRCDFHKCKTYTNSNHTNYQAPKVERRGSQTVTTQIEALPDRIYGYVKITVDK